jgi:hypothetical protein
MTDEGFDTGFKPSIDTNDTNNQEMPEISELSELIAEAEALGIQPFEETEPLVEPLEPNQDVPIDYDVVFEGLDEYNFDGKDYNQNSEQLNSLLEGFTEGNWNNMELEGQKEQITGLFDYVNDVIGLGNPPNIEYYNNPEKGDYGGYDPATNTLSINEYMLYDSNEAADTVAHELWHAYQHERAENPQSPKDFQYQIGFDNYIRPGDDFDGYQSQLVEAEARAFADQFKGALSQMGRA